jgi:hypothetical protein
VSVLAEPAAVDVDAMDVAVEVEVDAAGVLLDEPPPPHAASAPHRTENPAH